MNVDLLSVKSLLELFCIFSPLHMKCQNALGKQPYVIHLPSLHQSIFGFVNFRSTSAQWRVFWRRRAQRNLPLLSMRCWTGQVHPRWPWFDLNVAREEVQAWGTVVGSYTSGYHGDLLPSNNPVVSSVTIYFYVRGGERGQIRQQDMPSDRRNYVVAIVISMTTRNIANYGKREQNSRWTGYTVFHSFHPARSKIVSVTLKRATLLEANTELLKNWVANVPGIFQKITWNLYIFHRTIYCSNG